MCEVYKNKHGFVIPQEHVPSEIDMQKYADSDMDVVPVLIEGLVGYIVNSVEWFLLHSETAQPYSEDCVSEAMLELSRFSNQNIGKKYTPQHFMNAAKLSCLSRVKRWLVEMSITITVPRTSSHRNNISLTKQRLTSDGIVSSKDPVFQEVWFNEFLGLLDNFDRSLVELRMAGCSDRHIGREVNMDHRHVKNHLTRIANLYLDGE